MSEKTPQTNSLYKKIEELLKSIPELVTEEKELRYNKIKEMAENGDAILLIPLMQNAEIKNAFFSPILDSFVFKTKEFKEFLDYSSSNNSYSQYLGKKIGLYCGDSALTDRNEVVLNFPFKDCVLEGGQKKEDGFDTYFEYDEKTGEYVKKQSKRREVFFNETLAKDEIDNLFSPKAFCNVKKYTTAGETSCVDFSRDAEVNKKRGLSEDTITDNLIIKGNNLLALHSLKKEFEGKIKLIYIDPPYNTGSDGFSYNDNFNHSSWLTFMKNRLEVARDLLRDDGCIWISCDDREFAYLKVLCDEIFYSKNFLNDVIWNSTKSVTNTALISVSHTHNLVYFKIKEYYIKNRTEFRLKENGEGFSNPDNDPRGVWKADPFQVGGWRPNQQYEIINPKTKVVYHPNEGCSWKNDYEKFQELLKDNRIVFGVDGEAGPQRKRFLFEALERGKVAKTIWDDIDTTTNATQHNKKMFSRIVFSNPKPEALIQRILELSSNPSDIVLDYHLGSGTTAA
ncbi:MAG: site-specific DNA-methyltransferase, partial [Treponemataceae bacterium]|nr:site-specific DNA-methyltransferase [Treponemataceae bacterium]